MSESILKPKKYISYFQLLVFFLSTKLEFQNFFMKQYSTHLFLFIKASFKLYIYTCVHTRVYECVDTYIQDAKKSIWDVFIFTTIVGKHISKSKIISKNVNDYVASSFKFKLKQKLKFYFIKKLINFLIF